VIEHPVREHAAIRRALAVAAAAALTLGARSAAAQTCTVVLPPNPGQCSDNVTATVTIPKMAVISVSTSTTSAAATASDVELGYQNVGGPTITVKANTAWTAQLAAGAAVWSAVNTDPTTPARTNKPAGDLQYTVNGAGSYVSLSTAAAQLGTGSRTTGTNYVLAYKILYDVTRDTPGQYTLPVVLTVIAP
jgi:hypothetical protein